MHKQVLTWRALHVYSSKLVTNLTYFVGNNELDYRCFEDLRKMPTKGVS